MEYICPNCGEMYKSNVICKKCNIKAVAIDELLIENMKKIKNKISMLSEHINDLNSSLEKLKGEKYD